MTRLTVVARDVTPKAETVAERVRRLQAEARELAGEHVRQMIAQLAAVAETAHEIEAGHGAYPVGAVNEARVLGEECALRIDRLSAILARAER
jgi:hypothetical protein